MKYEAIHELSFYPVYEIYSINNRNDSINNRSDSIYKRNGYLVINSLEDKKFSIIKTEKFSKKCLENYYINSEYECPITQIYLENEKSYIYSSFHEVIIKEPQDYFYSTEYSGYNYNRQSYQNKTIYLYYTNNQSDSYGQLFSVENILETYNQFKSEIDSNYFEKLKRTEDNKIKNPLIGLKNYIKYTDFICLLLIILCFINTFFETCDNRKFNYFKIINIFIEISFFILYLVRYIKFIKVKNFFIKIITKMIIIMEIIIFQINILI